MPYDLIVVGTSPFSLIEASKACSQGEKVLIIDREKRIGGAWRVFDLFGLKDIEHTPHVFFPDKTAYKMLEKYLYCDLIGQPIPPKRCYWARPEKSYQSKINQTLRHSIYRNFVAFKVSDKSLVKRIKLFVKRCLRSHARNIPRSQRQNICKYPRYGLGHWFKGILTEFKKKGIDVRLDKEVLGVNIDHQNTYITLSDGEKISTGRLILNRNFEAKQVTIFGIPYMLDYQISYSWHHAYLIENNKLDIGFTDCSGLEDIELLNDNTSFTPGLKEMYPEARLIQFRTLSQGGNSETRSPEQYIDLLKLYGVISPESRLLKSNVSPMKRKQISKNQITNLIDKSGGLLDILSVDDLSLVGSIGSRLEN